MDFKGKVAVITGAGNGIGRQAALGFAGRGARVLVVDRDAAGAERTVETIKQQGGEARAQPADVTKSAEVQAYVKAAVDAWVASTASSTTPASRASTRRSRSTTRPCSTR